MILLLPVSLSALVTLLVLAALVNVGVSYLDNIPLFKVETPKKSTNFSWLRVTGWVILLVMGFVLIFNFS